MFSTPVMLVELISVMQEEQRQAIEFIYLGGMSVAAATMNELGEAFPNAQLLSGYGNTLFGVSHELAPHRPDNQLPVYFPPAERIGIRVVSMDEDKTDSERLRRVVAFDERGQIVMHRLDQSCFLANVMERDSGIRVAAASNGNNRDGIKDPQPIQTKQFIVENGIY
jgi:acyl-CoA synthetase (AMP-forming)/AMP-acid ligase II